MRTTLIVIENDADLAEAKALLGQRMVKRNATDADIARLRAQAQLIETYEAAHWPRRKAKPADIIRYLMDQHGLSRADMIPLLGTASRVNEVLNGKKPLSMSMVQRLRARFGIPADLLLPAPTGRQKVAA